jgi:hypothetical protein
MLFRLGLVANALTALIVSIPLTLGSTVSNAVAAAEEQPSLIGSPAVFGDGTYPRAVKLADGSLLGVYTAFSNGNNVITTTHSVDQGSTWNNLGTVTSGVGDIDNPFLLQLPNGRVICAFRNHSKDPSTGKYTFFRITICYSDDNGATWAFLSEPASGPGPDHGIWEPFMRLSSRNSANIQLYYSFENGSTDQDSLLRTSTDGGVTWSSPSTISGGDVTARDGMIGVAVAPGGNSDDLIAVFESYDSLLTNLFTIRAVSSSDDGATWGNRRLVYAATGANNNAGASQIINVGGTLVVSL